MNSSDLLNGHGTQCFALFLRNAFSESWYQGHAPFSKFETPCLRVETIEALSCRDHYNRCRRNLIIGLVTFHVGSLSLQLGPRALFI